MFPERSPDAYGDEERAETSWGATSSPLLQGKDHSVTLCMAAWPRGMASVGCGPAAEPLISALEGPGPKRKARWRDPVCAGEVGYAAWSTRTLRLRGVSGRGWAR